MIRFKETAADYAVKDRLWKSTEAEVMHFSRRYCEEHVTGERSSQGQEEVIGASEKKGYPVGLIRSLGSIVRRRKVAQEKGKPEADLIEAEAEALAAYRSKINLAHRGAAGS